MAKSIKPRMSNDLLSGFDRSVISIELNGGEAEILLSSTIDDFGILRLNEKDCKDIIDFIRRYK